MILLRAHILIAFQRTNIILPNANIFHTYQLLKSYSLADVFTCAVECSRWWENCPAVKRNTEIKSFFSLVRRRLLNKLMNIIYYWSCSVVCIWMIINHATHCHNNGVKGGEGYLCVDWKAQWVRLKCNAILKSDDFCWFEEKKWNRNFIKLIKIIW